MARTSKPARSYRLTSSSGESSPSERVVCAWRAQRSHVPVAANGFESAAIDANPNSRRLESRVVASYDRDFRIDEGGTSGGLRASGSRVLAEAGRGVDEPQFDAAPERGGGNRPDDSFQPGNRLGRSRRSGRRDDLRRHFAQGADQTGEEGRSAECDRAAARLGELRRDHQRVQEEVRPQDG